MKNNLTSTYESKLLTLTTMDSTKEDVKELFDSIAKDKRLNEQHKGKLLFKTKKLYLSK